MNVQFKIVRVDHRSASLLVHYYTDDHPDGTMLNVSVPLEGGGYLTGDALVQHIKNCAPVDVFETMDKVARTAANFGLPSDVLHESAAMPGQGLDLATTKQLAVDNIRAAVSDFRASVLPSVAFGDLLLSELLRESRVVASDETAPAPLLQQVFPGISAVDAATTMLNSLNKSLGAVAFSEAIRLEAERRIGEATVESDVRAALEAALGSLDRPT